MADVYAVDFANKPLNMAEYGNTLTEVYRNTGKAAAVSDKLYLGKIPAGTQLAGVTLRFLAGIATSTVSLGFEPEDGVSPAANLTAFFNAQSGAAAGNFDAVFAPITFDRPVNLVATIGGAGQTAGNVVVITRGLAVGAK